MRTEFIAPHTLPTHLRKLLLLAALAAACPIAGHAATSATVEFAIGKVAAISPNGLQRDLGKGALLLPGETVSTGKDSRAQLRFSDGAMMSLQPDTEFRIDQYEFNDKADGKERGFFSLLKGGLRTITGLIGRSNKLAYKLNTAVATVGIRGTEYAMQYSGGADGVLNISTGEGEIEVCNGGGCVFVSGGESAIVSGANTPPQRTEVRPTLPPQATSVGVIVAIRDGEQSPLLDGSLLPSNAFSIADNRTSNGSIAPLSKPLISGSGYTEAHIGMENLTLQSGGTAVSATFSPNSELLSFTDGSASYNAHRIATSFTKDGAIGWGHWDNGAKVGTGNALLRNTHYVIGTATPNFGSLSMASATYKLAGFTKPTTASGMVGTSVSGQMSLSFGGGYPSGSLDLKVGINGQSVGYTGISISGTGTSIAGGSSSTVLVNGFIAGNTGQYAGIAYQLNGIPIGVGAIFGSAVFQRQ